MHQTSLGHFLRHSSNRSIFCFIKSQPLYEADDKRCVVFFYMVLADWEKWQKCWIQELISRKLYLLSTPVMPENPIKDLVKWLHFVPILLYNGSRRQTHLSRMELVVSWWHSLAVSETQLKLGRLELSGKFKIEFHDKNILHKKMLKLHVSVAWHVCQPFLGNSWSGFVFILTDGIKG